MVRIQGAAHSVSAMPCFTTLRPDRRGHHSLNYVLKKIRAAAFCAGPYVKRGAVVGTQYNTTSILRTIEQILGLPPMNQFDASATPMFDCFTNVPDFTPYTSLPNNVPLAQGASFSGPLTPKQRAWAKKLQKMDFSKPDRINDDVFNRYIWFSIKGDARYPAEFVGGQRQRY